jgi:hypothetical protein
MADLLRDELKQIAALVRKRLAERSKEFERAIIERTGTKCLEKLEKGLAAKLPVYITARHQLPQTHWLLGSVLEGLDNRYTNKTGVAT